MSTNVRAINGKHIDTMHLRDMGLSCVDRVEVVHARNGFGRHGVSTRLEWTDMELERVDGAGPAMPMPALSVSYTPQEARRLAIILLQGAEAAEEAQRREEADA